MKSFLLVTISTFFIIGCGKKYLYKEIDQKWIECRGSTLSWRVVPHDEGEDMEKEFSSCTDCEVPSRFDFNVRNIAEIKKRIEALGFKVSGMQMVPAVYIDRSVERYACRVCNGDNSDDACKVNHYETLLLKAEVPDSEEGSMYFDMVKICPPPRGCDRATITSDSTDMLNMDSTKRSQ